MKNLFVPYELMLGLEAKGFAEDCICGYNRSQILVSKVSYSSGKDCECKWNKRDDFEVRAATWMQAIDWFREKYEIDIAIIRSGGMTIDERGPIKFYEIYIYQLSPSKVGTGYNYYGALTRAIEKALTHIKL